MDPKTFAKLDPKLRETYERVMGTTIPQKPTIIPAPPSTSPTVATNSPVTTSILPQTPLSTVSSAPSVTPAHEQTTEPVHTSVTQPTTVAPVAQTPMHSTIAVHTAVATASHEEKKGEHENAGAVPAWKKIMFIVLGITFFGIYAMFWLLFFKVKLPF
jgi:hypothetical protein